MENTSFLYSQDVGQNHSTAKGVTIKHLQGSHLRNPCPIGHVQKQTFSGSPNSLAQELQLWVPPLAKFSSN